MSDLLLLAGLATGVVAAWLVALPLGIAVLSIALLALAWATRPDHPGGPPPLTRDES